MFLNYYFLIFFSFFLVGTSAEKILFLLPIASRSHKNVFEPLIKALADRTHSVVVASPFLPQNPYPHVKEIVSVPYEEIFQFPDPFEMRRKSRLVSMLTISNLNEGCEKAYLNKEFDELKDQHFDLIFLNGFGNDCFAGLVYKIGAPFVMFTTVAAPSAVAENVGNRLPTSFVPSPMMDGTDDMDFWERMFNLLMDFNEQLFMRWNNPKMEIIYRQYLGEDIPGIEEIKANVSMIFSNSHFVFNTPRPLLPDIIEVGGLHCRRAKPLPQELDDFLSGAEHGFIYFSMGSTFETNQMPEETRKVFLNVFSRLKQRVIWKWNSEQMTDLPGNVQISQWLPQQDILGHPNIKLFMTHGGLLSTQEAVYHGVPLVGIPVFGDQDLNVKQAVKNGYALMLEILDLSEELLEDRLLTILNDPKFVLQAKHLSLVVKHQFETPLERAVFWTEYLLRHKGASHLRSAARNLNFFQYYSLDIVAFLSAIVILSSLLLLRLTKFLLQLDLRGESAATLPTREKKSK